MKIEIDTKEDLHNLRHIIQFLSAISSNSITHKKTPSLFDETPSLSSTNSNPFASLFGDSTPSTSSTSSSNDSSSTGGFFNMFDMPASSPSTVIDKKEEPKGDFIDSLQVY